MAEFELNRAGLAEIFRGDGMQSALREAARSMCASANAEGRRKAAAAPGELGRDSAGRVVKDLRADPYGFHVDVLSGTAVGAVHTNGEMGRRVESAFKALHHQGQ